MLDLNNIKNEEFVVFNGGVAGSVSNVGVTVEKKKSSDHMNAPDYKVIFTDQNGGTCNVGFYYPTKMDNQTKEAFDRGVNMNLRRIREIVDALGLKDYKFPAVSSVKEAYDVFFTVIRDNSEGKLVKVYCNYGTTVRPSIYLSPRFFSFCKENTESQVFLPDNRDVMERIVPDESSNMMSQTSMGAPTPPSDEDDAWLMQ